MAEPREIVTAGPRAVGELLAGLPPVSRALVDALPAVVRQLPAVVADLHVVVRELGRLAAPDGELTVLLQETARLAASRADAPRADAAVAPRSPRRAARPPGGGQRG